MRKLLITLGAFALLLPTSRAYPPVKPAPAAEQKQMEEWWTDLEKGEEIATGSLLKLAARPKESVAFLKEKMKPLKIDAVRVRDLISKLDSDKEEIWKPAFEEMEYFDPRLAIDLVKLMDETTENPARCRLVDVLCGYKAGTHDGQSIELRSTGDEDAYNFSSRGSSWWAEYRVSRLNTHAWGGTKYQWTRAVRAIILLEHIGNSDARVILKDMASGHAEAQPTKSAKEALKRLAEINR